MTFKVSHIRAKFRSACNGRIERRVLYNSDDQTQCVCLSVAHSHVKIYTDAVNMKISRSSDCDVRSWLHSLCSLNTKLPHGIFIIIRLLQKQRRYIPLLRRRAMPINGCAVKLNLLYNSSSNADSVR